MTTKSSNGEFVGGVLNLVGTRPGNGFQYPEPAMVDSTWFTLTFTSTHDAIEKLIVPPGLTVDRDAPPEVVVRFFTQPECRAYDGRLLPYQGFMFMARVRHGDVTGCAGWEYVDAIYGDKTEIDTLVPWGTYFGMLKKLADIRFVPLAGNEFEVSVTRRGIRLATLRIRTGSEMSKADVDLINSSGAQWPKTLTVREIPNTDFSGYVERAVCIGDTENTNIIKQAWAAEGLSLTFGNDELDPLSELPVLDVTGAVVYKMDVLKELFSEMTILDHLPVDTNVSVLSRATV